MVTNTCLTKFWSEIQNGGMLTAVLNDGIHCSYGLHVYFFLSLKYIFVILPHMYIRYLYGKLHSHGFAFKVQTAILLSLKYRSSHIYTSSIGKATASLLGIIVFCFCHWNIRNSLIYTLYIGDGPFHALGLWDGFALKLWRGVKIAILKSLKYSLFSQIHVHVIFLESWEGFFCSEWQKVWTSILNDDFQVHSV